VLFIGVASIILLWLGSIRWIQNLLKYMVLLMVACFLITAILVRPNISDILSDLTKVNFSKDILLIGALVGTTIGPYNIFLHSKTASQRWHVKSEIKEMFIDTVISIGLGGLISCCIIVVAATIARSYSIQELDLNNFSQVLSAPLGQWGNSVFLLGLFAAGASSAITAPYGAAYTIAELFESSVTEENKLFRIIYVTVLFVGTVIALAMGTSPTVLILLAQYTNAIILPLIIVFLVFCINKQNRETIVINTLFFIVLVISLLLGVRLFVQ
jgi:Mn2+/Fe2+ NRAMP family transporter